MAGLSFDDLIPAQGGQQAALSFDDLIPSVSDAPAAGVAGDASAAVGRGLVNGVPIIGPYALSGLEHAAAGVRSLQSGEPYADELKRVQGYSQQTADANPGATTAGEIGGGIVGTAPLIAAAPAVFGAGSGGLALRSAASMGTGAIMGGADSAVRSGGDPIEARNGAIAGGALGVVAPAAGSAIGAGIRKFYDLVGGLRAPESGFGSAATRMLGEDVAHSGGVDAVRSRLDELGSPAMLLDASPSLQGQAQGLAVRPETRQAVTAPIMARTAGTSDRLAQDVNGALGPAQSAPTATVDLRGQRMAPNQAIGAAVDGATDPVSAQNVVYSIDGRLPLARGSEEAVLRRARSMLARDDADDRIAPRTTMGDDLGGTMAGLVGGPKGYALSQAARAGKAVINAMGRESDVARNRQLADAVTLGQGDRLNMLLDAINARGLMQQRAAQLGQLGARGTQAAMLSQSDRAGPYLPAPNLLLR
ncbi:hypothetical protein MKK88_26875 [Methylobacterium sp. E-005]|uniref:hypothetical protein n=1 Tax=Methylobacterium sp. E-005 TaxID=2836549 RepID=UPI001FB8E2F8|nr:hypothetical protein [Methylobacterium sp. E-005]MCJ2089585.1 hypothetical protein [Methylobacterium sp. E-005]